MNRAFFFKPSAGFALLTGLLMADDHFPALDDNALCFGINLEHFAGFTAIFHFVAGDDHNGVAVEISS